MYWSIYQRILHDLNHIVPDWSWFNHLGSLWSLGTFSVFLSKLDKYLENWLGLQIKLLTQKKQIAINVGKYAFLKELS